MNTVTKKVLVTLTILVFAVSLIYAGDGQIDIAELPYTITQSGSYIVVDDLTLLTLDTNGITISADNVTLDLNGHALIGPGKAAGTSGNGIYVNTWSQHNIAIRNGTVRDWRACGINAIASNSQFEALRCYNNGENGISAGQGCTVNDNTCYSNGGDGIGTEDTCTITGNSCFGNIDNGITAGDGSTVNRNACRQNMGNGITSIQNSTVTGNACSDNDIDGIHTSPACTVTGNTCNSNRVNGIHVANFCRVAENTCNFNGMMMMDGAGIQATNSSNCIINNHCTDNYRGLDLDAANNIVSGNTLIGNTTPIDAVAGNQLDVLISELPYTISLPGMYRLSGDLSLATQDTHGITISTDDVTLDLNGHSLTGPGKAAGTIGHGIYVSGTRYNIAVRNGSVRDWRDDGIYSGAAFNTQFESLRCYNNGGAGIRLSNGGSKLLGNTCYLNDGDGIAAAFGCTITGNACRDNGGDGINSDNCTISGNACYSNIGDGIESSNSLISGNCCMINGTNYNLTTCTSVNNHP